MATKRKASDQSDSESNQAKKTRRQVTIHTFEKWRSLYERKYQSMMWLRHTSDRSKRSLVDTIWCRACRQYKDKIIGMKNFSRVWINGSSNHKTSNIVDHATSDQHKAAMVQVQWASGEPVTTYSPIAQSLLTMDDAVLTRMKQKFDICYVMVKENLPFMKYSALHELELRHGVNLGQAYKTKDSAKLFTHYIARSLRQDFISSLTD